MNLIITGGNKNYFSLLKVFVKSATEKGDFKGKIVICDNTINGKWNKPESINLKSSFSKEQHQFFSKYNVDIIKYSRLLEEFKIPIRHVEKIKTAHWAYPAKFLYCNLIAEKYKKTVEKIAFFDADVYFQDNINILFEKITDNSIYINDEGVLNKNSNYMTEWLNFSQINNLWGKFRCYDLSEKPILCTGFFAAKTENFLSITNLAVLLSTNQIYPFHSDQPLMNFIMHAFKFPYKTLPNDVIHAAHIKIDELQYIENKKIFNIKNKTPKALHYHGKHGNYIKQKIISNYSIPDYVQPNLIRKIIMKIKQKTITR